MCELNCVFHKHSSSGDYEKMDERINDFLNGGIHEFIIEYNEECYNDGDSINKTGTYYISHKHVINRESNIVDFKYLKYVGSFKSQF